MSPLAKATRPSAQRRRASSMGIERVTIGELADGGCSRMAVANLVIASLPSGWAVTAVPFGGDAIAARETNTGCSTTAFIAAADGSIRGQNAKPRIPANAPAARPARTFH